MMVKKDPDIIEKKWYAQWFDENYLQLYGHRNLEDAKNQIELIRSTLPLRKDMIILDLGCGQGRHCILLRDYGFKVVGMDLSSVLLKKARQEWPEILLIRGDKRHIPGYFDVILSLFTSFGYFETDDEHVKTLEEIYRSLNPGGYFWLDFLNATYIKQNLIEKTERNLPDGIKVAEVRWIENGFVFKKITFSSKRYTKEYIERVRLYSKEELTEMLTNTGFQIIHQFGNYEGKSWEIKDERTILVARKKN